MGEGAAGAGLINANCSTPAARRDHLRFRGRGDGATLGTATNTSCIDCDASAACSRSSRASNALVEIPSCLASSGRGISTPSSPQASVISR